MGSETAVLDMRERLQPRGNTKMTKNECARYVDELISESYDNWRTVVYDGWQYCCQGIN